MNIVRTSVFGDGIHSTKYTIYASNTEYRDLRTALTMLFVPSPTEEEEDDRVNLLRHFTTQEINRMRNIVEQLNGQL